MPKRDNSVHVRLDDEAYEMLKMLSDAQGCASYSELAAVFPVLMIVLTLFLIGA